MLAKLFVTNLKMFTRDKGTLAATLLFPVLMSVIYGLAVKSNVKPLKLVVAASPAPASQQLISALEGAREKNIKIFIIRRVNSEKAAREAFKSTQIDGALIVPDITEKGVVTFLYDEKSPEKYFRAIGLVEAAIKSYNLQRAGAVETVQFLRQGLRGGDRGQGFEAFLPGLLMFTVVLSSLSFGASRIIGYRETGVFKRLMVTPLRPRVFLSAEILSRATIASVQTTVVLLLAVVAYDAQVKGAAFWLFLLAIMGALFFVMIGFAISGMSDSPTAAAGVAQLLGLLLIMFGGGFPTSFLPPALGKILGYLPVAPMSDAMRVVILDGKSPITAAPRESIILTTWVAFSIALAYLTFRFREPSKKR
ncbi:MAG TPA: ABC transporter permease [Actinomycetota bacterium]|nr:ABC transporter permease [Actinomycetota bacterium]